MAHVRNKAKKIDWEQRRYEIAKCCYESALNAGYKYEESAKAAVIFADELIKNLKNN